jgi:hypothetical protein
MALIPLETLEVVSQNFKIFPIAPRTEADRVPPDQTRDHWG